MSTWKKREWERNRATGKRERSCKGRCGWRDVTADMPCRGCGTGMNRRLLLTFSALPVCSISFITESRLRNQVIGQPADHEGQTYIVTMNCTHTVGSPKPTSARRSEPESASPPPRSTVFLVMLDGCNVLGQCLLSKETWLAKNKDNSQLSL